MGFMDKKSKKQMNDKVDDMQGQTGMSDQPDDSMQEQGDTTMDRRKSTESNEGM